MSRYRKSMAETMAEVERIGQELPEVAPPGWEGSVKAMKKHKDIDNPWALAWHMKNKGNKPHYKDEDGKPEKKEKYKEDVDEANLPPHLAKFFDKKGNPKPDAAKRMADGQKKREVKYKTKDVTPKGYGPNEEEVSKESKHYGPNSHLAEPSPEDKFDYKPKKGEVVASGSGSIAKAKKAKASDVNKSIEQQMADARKENVEFELEGIERKTVIRKGKKVTVAQSTKAGHKVVNTGGAPKEVKQTSTEKLGRIKSQKIGAKKRRTTQAISQAGRAKSMSKAAKLGLHKESLEFEVKIAGLPKFYVPAKTAAQVKLALRKQLKHPEDIESITRVTKARQKIDFRLRAQGKGPKSEPLGSKRFRKDDVE